MSEVNTPLVVDLDGTLTRSDLLYESVCALLKNNLLYLLALPFWLLGGKAALKRQIARRADVAVDLLPWNDEFLSWLKEQKAAGRRLVLATASDKKYADAVAEHLSIFDDVIASDGSTNLSGQWKLDAIKATLNNASFEYAGNAPVDAKIWQQAAGAVVVNPIGGAASAAASATTVRKTFDDKGSTLAALMRAMRPHQWLKNVLVFVPLGLSHHLADWPLVIQSCLAFIAFSACASGVYLVNDLLDLPSDRAHASKRKRPFAAGDLSLAVGGVAAVLLTVLAFGIALILPLGFLVALANYFVLTLLYSSILKRAALIDVLTLAGLYTLRLLAGASAIQVEASFWLLSFSMFTFFSLALIKRYSELMEQIAQGKVHLAGRGYREVDLPLLGQMGIASGYLAVMVLALYIDSDAVKQLYSTPQALWMLCPSMLYWISRLWLLTRRGEMHEDPVVFTIEDRRTHWLVLFGAFCIWGAIVDGL